MKIGAVTLTAIAVALIMGMLVNVLFMAFDKRDDKKK